MALKLDTILKRGRYRKENARIRDKPKFKIGKAECISQTFTWDFGLWHKIFTPDRK